MMQVLLIMSGFLSPVSRLKLLTLLRQEAHVVASCVTSYLRIVKECATSCCIIKWAGLLRGMKVDLYLHGAFKGCDEAQHFFKAALVED